MYNEVASATSLNRKLHENDGKAKLGRLNEEKLLQYSSFTSTWLMTNDFQVEFFSFDYKNNGNWVFVKK